MSKGYITGIVLLLSGIVVTTVVSCRGSDSMEQKDFSVSITEGLKIKCGSFTYAQNHGADGDGFGYGGSAVLWNDSLYFPESSVGAPQLLMRSDNRIVAGVSYSDIKTDRNTWFRVDRQVTVFKGQPYVTVIDAFSGNFADLMVLVGVDTDYTGGDLSGWSSAYSRAEITGPAVNGDDYKALRVTVNPGQTIRYVVGEKEALMKLESEGFSLF